MFYICHSQRVLNIINIVNIIAMKRVYVAKHTCILPNLQRIQ